jgi:hypothetical protein
MMEPDANVPKNMSRLLPKPSTSLTLIDVDPVCEILFHKMKLDPGSPVVELVFAS